MASKKNLKQKDLEEDLDEDVSKSKKTKKEEKKFLDLHPEAQRSVWGIVLLALSLIMLLGAFGWAGSVGDFFYEIMQKILGIGFFLIPIILIVVAVLFLTSQDEHSLYKTSLIGGGLLLLSGLGIFQLINEEAKYGGYVGWIVGMPLIKLFGYAASWIFLVAVAIVSLIIIFNISIARAWNDYKKKDDAILESAEELELNQSEKSRNGVQQEESDNLSSKETSKDLQKTRLVQEEKNLEGKKNRKLYASFASNYPLPPLNLLEEDKETPSSGDTKAYSNIIKRTLETFGLAVEMAEINVGPTVTQYTLKPAQGVKLSKITSLQNDLALALAAHPIRIEAPIPGRSLVGIEVPNKSVARVRARNLLAEKTFFEHSSSLLFALGRDVMGGAVYANLAKMPHLLIAGATGSGKSVALHVIINSLLYRNSPRTLRFLIIDPKRVEMSAYKDLPHLLAPVVIEREKAIQSLRWAVKEMERRYEVLSEAGNRDIDSYNSQIINSGDDASLVLPYLVIVIDELADLIMSFPREVEGSIVRLAQMSRAVGIHLIISTQRPSVEIITGLIKANITSRIALQVATQVDSRTILDISGAEKLLGNGDMLYLAGDTSKPRRIQGAFISDEEVKRVVDYWKSSAKKMKDELGEQIDFEEQKNQGEINFDDMSGEFDDELFEDARDVVIKAGKASTSLLQRRLRIGYARAARLIDLLEEQGIVGPGEGAKPRRILVGREEASPRLVGLGPRFGDPPAGGRTAPQISETEDDSKKDDEDFGL
jgi:S-DNA-T family DNA segregation ATPase FtsK/SpoIIIE